MADNTGLENMWSFMYIYSPTYKYLDMLYLVPKQMNYFWTFFHLKTYLYCTMLSLPQTYIYFRKSYLISPSCELIHV